MTRHAMKEAAKEQLQNQKVEADREPHLGEIVDAGELQAIMENFYQLTRIGGAVLDLSGEVLASVGWQDICEKFHRVHPESRKNCRESDTLLSRGVSPGTFKEFRCKNNMRDMVTPIEVNGRHLGNIFIGQFFLKGETPDRDLFRKQARKFGFDEAAYLEALDRVPFFNRATLEAAMQFYARLAQMVASLGYSRIQMARAVIEREKAFKEQHESDERYRLLVETSNDIVWTFDLASMTYTFCSPAVERILGYPVEMVKGASLDTIFSPETKKKIEKTFGKALTGGSAAPRILMEAEHRRRDGSGIHLEISGTLQKDASGNPVAFTGISRDVSERRRAEEERALLISAIEQAAEAILITNASGTIQYVNPAFETITGYKSGEIVGKNPRVLKSGKQGESFYRDMWETISGGEKWEGRFVNKRKDGSFYTEKASISPVMDESGGIVNYVAVKRDITDELRLEERLLQAQKMEAIGTLAGGIAHDFNNILFPLVGFAELLQEDLPAESPLQNHIHEILKAALRSRELVKQILAFSRQSEEEIRPVKPQTIIWDALKLSVASIPKTIEIEKKIDSKCGLVLVDPTQLHQIVMNLVTNAYHAMEKKGGKLGMRLQQVRLDPGCSAVQDLPPGDYALITVTDTGVGIEKDVLEKVFDPYFTTKEEGKGTGLGLSVVHGIVKKCKGDVRINSEPGNGTEVQVYLPIMVRQDDVLQGKENEPVVGGREKILLVDDEESIVRMVQQMLERLGYTVVVRTGSVEALEAFRAASATYDLVITDMTMPNMTGVQLAREIRKLQPEMPIILCTGFSDQMNKEKSEAMGIQGFVMKPLIKREIAATIREVLDR